MKLESILKNFLPSSISPKSIESFANNVETFGKIIAGLLAIFYVAGLILFGLYHSNLHIRSIELLQVRYLFVGFYYFAFMFCHLAVPIWWIKRIWLKILYLLSFLLLVIFLNPIHNTYLSYLIEKAASGTSYFEFKSSHISVLNGNLIVLVTSFILAPVALFVAVYVPKLIKIKQLRILFVVLVLFAFGFNYQIFTKNVFPFIPDGIGGGQPPIVHIVFADDVPYEVTSNFDLAGQVSGFLGDYYYGRLVYIDNDSVFLQEPFWYANYVYEIQRKDIIMLEYKEYNPAELGQPGLIP